MIMKRAFSEILRLRCSKLKYIIFSLLSMWCKAHFVRAIFSFEMLLNSREHGISFSSPRSFRPPQSCQRLTRRINACQLQLPTKPNDSTYPSIDDIVYDICWSEWSISPSNPIIINERKNAKMNGKSSTNTTSSTRVLSACGEQLNGRGRIVHHPISPFHFTSTCHAVLSSSLLLLFSLPKTSGAQPVIVSIAINTAISDHPHAASHIRKARLRRGFTA